MSNNRKTLVSMRLDNEVVSQLDELVRYHRFFSRTYFVCKLLRALFMCGGKDVVNEIVRHFDPYDEGLVITISKSKKS